MIGFKNWLEWLEEAKTTAKNLSTSDLNGKIHEVLVAKHLNGGKFIDDYHKDHHDKLMYQVGGSTSEKYKDEHKKAQHATEHIKKHLGVSSFKKVGIVSKAGDIKKFTDGKHNLSQHEDASDVMVQHHDGTHHGISLKSTQKHGAQPGVHNEGHKAVDKRLGVDTTHHIKGARQKIVNQRTEMAGMNDTQAKAHLKTDETANVVASEHGRTALKNIRDDWHGAYQKMTSKDRAHHLRHLLHATPNQIPHIRAHASGQNADHKTQVHSPSTHFDHILKDHANIHMKKAGNGGIRWDHHHPKTGVITRVASERAKFDSGVSSPVKTSVI